MQNLKTLLRFTIIGIAGAATVGGLNGLLPETTAATLTCINQNRGEARHPAARPYSCARPHPAMPMLILSPDETDAIVVFSLAQKAR